MDLELNRTYDGDADVPKITRVSTVAERFDYTSFVSTPVLPFDASLTSGDTTAGFHSFVLKKISSVFRDILEGDSNCSEIKIDDIDAKFLEVLQYVVYSPPGERNSKGLQTKSKRKGSRMQTFFTGFASVNTLISKYDVKLLLPIAKSIYNDWVTNNTMIHETFSEAWKQGKKFEAMFRDAQDKNLDELAEIVKSKHISAFGSSEFSYMKLDSFPSWLMIDLIQSKSEDLTLNDFKIVGKRAAKEQDKKLWRILNVKLNKKTESFRKKWRMQLFD